GGAAGPAGGAAGPAGGAAGPGKAGGTAGPVGGAAGPAGGAAGPAGGAAGPAGGAAGPGKAGGIARPAKGSGLKGSGSRGTGRGGGAAGPLKGSGLKGIAVAKIDLKSPLRRVTQHHGQNLLSRSRPSISWDLDQPQLRLELRKTVQLAESRLSLDIHPQTSLLMPPQYLNSPNRSQSTFKSRIAVGSTVLSSPIAHKVRSGVSRPHRHLRRLPLSVTTAFQSTMLLPTLPPELYHAILAHIPPRSLQRTSRPGVSNAPPAPESPTHLPLPHSLTTSPVLQRPLFEHIAIKHALQAAPSPLLPPTMPSLGHMQC
ncbi:hypothetical protein M422DRAFT_241377, partial [Sphaerobolus stellatus SS14]